MINLIAAVPSETDRLSRHLAAARPGRQGDFFWLQGRIGATDVRLMASGVGKANAAAAAALLLSHHGSALTVAFGCGGAFPESGLEVGDLAVATAEVFGDEGVLTPTGFVDLEGMGLASAEGPGGRLFNRFPVDDGLLERLREPLSLGLADRSVRFGPLVTVSTCSGTLESGRDLARRTAGICENMEGAAVAQVCCRFGQPFLEVRGISNLVEDRNPKRWDLQAGARSAQEAVLVVLRQLGESGR